MTRARVAVLGGGMAGLVTAWELSRGDWRDRLESITVYQRGWRLGGKGASSRGLHGRIEEHGLHVLLGYYDATFRVLREVYAELDRERTDPSCPLRTWRDAVEPSGDVGLAERDGHSWSSFVTRFSVNDAVPGEPGAEHRPLRPVDVALRAVGLLSDFQASLAASAPAPPAAPPRVHLSSSPRPDGRAAGAATADPASRLATLVRGGGLTAVAGALTLLERASSLTGDVAGDAALTQPLAALLGAWRDGVRAAVLTDPSARRTWQLVDLAVTNVVGMAVDGLLTGRGYERIDHLDYREWLARHGAAPETLDSPIVRGMYDLVFAYEGGDKSRPRFAAGLGLQLASRMLFDFKGAIFWRMQAGMGEVVFAPLYQALARRGVRVELFHRLDRLELGPDGALAAVHLTRQADRAAGCDGYDPLVRVNGLPAWPDQPLVGQLADDPGRLLESHAWAGPSAGSVRLGLGEDVDVAVLAVSLGMVPHVAAELVETRPAWRAMVENVATVGTRAAQLWLSVDEAALGWDGPSGVTLSGFGDTFDTWASMTHLLAREQWPGGDPPRSLAYLCSALPDTDPQQAQTQVRSTLREFLDTEVAALWPGAAGADGFRWELLWDDQARTGTDRLDAQYLRANLDPSDRYVQSLPGSGRFRISPGGTGVPGLVVAGDWTACGLDAGCVEAATRSGVLAAQAVLDQCAASAAAAP
jgi:uncharacterized protein with NAD-binding domain and iron-sulfur cluster